MGSKERIQRLKDDTRRNILTAALNIVKEDGWQSLNMRRIALDIDYTAPVIYEYFDSKESLIAELTYQGYTKLLQSIRTAGNQMLSTVEQLLAMWLAYWNFAFTEKELYQAMFGIEVHCSSMKSGHRKSEELATLFTDMIRQLVKDKEVSEEIINTKYFRMWSVVHGLISINLVNKGKSEEINQRVLHEAIHSTITSIAE